MPGCTFVDDMGRDILAVNAAEMLEVDRIAINETGPNLHQMMENAGRNLAEMVSEMLGPDWASSHVVVLAGTGGNGGGGITAGRHLMNHGGRVSVVITQPERLGDVPSDQLDLFRNAGGTLSPDPPETADLIIDAVIGYSLRGAPEDRALSFIEHANRSPAPVVSLDIPSGLDATTGRAPGAVVVADTTMTLALPKIGLCADVAGDLVLADIGITAATYRRLGKPEGSAVFDGRYRLPLQRNLNADD